MSEIDEKIAALEEEIAALNERVDELTGELDRSRRDGGRFEVGAGTVSLRKVSEQVEDALQHIWAVRRTLERMDIKIAPTRQELAQEARALEFEQSEAAKRNE